MQKKKLIPLLASLAMFICASNPLRAEPTLGDAPRAPADISGLPGGGPHPKSVTGGFSVDINSREQVRWVQIPPPFKKSCCGASTGFAPWPGFRRR
jgi:hypothetical protein